MVSEAGSTARGVIVYLVVSGEYSGTTHRAAFATEALALQAIEDFADDSYDWCSPHVEEYEVMEIRAVQGYRMRTWFYPDHETPADEDNSMAHRVEEIPEWELRRSVPATAYVEDARHPNDWEKYGHIYCLTAEGTDKIRVIKAFGEKRAQVIALPYTLATPEEIELAVRA